jgi:hypothetical protein
MDIAYTGMARKLVYEVVVASFLKFLDLGLECETADLGEHRHVLVAQINIKTEIRINVVIGHRIPPRTNAGTAPHQWE